MSDSPDVYNCFVMGENNVAQNTNSFVMGYDAVQIQRWRHHYPELAEGVFTRLPAPFTGLGVILWLSEDDEPARVVMNLDPFAVLPFLCEGTVHPNHLCVLNGMEVLAEASK